MPKPWNPGTGIGRGYRLERLLGRGGAGEVWLARDPHLNRFVAIKVLWVPDAERASIRRFADEARALAHVLHPSIVTVFDLGEEDNAPYIVMEYVDGLDLATIIAKGPVRISWGIHVARQVVEGLQYAHERQLIHRDIKPSNILVSAAGDRAKLTDFGLAKGLESSGAVTPVGAVIGTPLYMAPARAARKLDQWAARKVDHLRTVHSTLFSSETTMIGCGNVGISRSARDFQAAVEIVL